MRQVTVFALSCSCLAHFIFFWAVSSISKGVGDLNSLGSQSSALVVNVSNLSVKSSASYGQTSRLIEGSRSTSLSTKPINLASDVLFSPSFLPNPATNISQESFFLPRDTSNLIESYGLQGKSEITYWPFDAVDQPALLLAQWPESMSTSAWPPGQPVVLELWVNPDGALADIAFPQKDLPDSLRITLVETILNAGFKPAVKNGLPVGNYRVLEVLLSQTFVPPIVTY